MADVEYRDGRVSAFRDAAENLRTVAAILGKDHEYHNAYITASQVLEAQSSWEAENGA